MKIGSLQNSEQLRELMWSWNGACDVLAQKVEAHQVLTVVKFPVTGDMPEYNLIRFFPLPSEDGVKWVASVDIGQGSAEEVMQKLMEVA